VLDRDGRSTVSRRARHTALVAIGALGLLGACGSSDDGASPATSPPTVDAPTTTQHVGRLTVPCFATRDAARAASAAYYANNLEFPTTFRQLTAGPAPVLELGEVTLVNDTTLAGATWTLTMTGGGTDTPEFECTDGP
jgi:hypothetical protein